MGLPDNIAGAILTIDLGALVANYRRLQRRVAPAQLSAVVKADAYGLGAAHVVPVLLAAGCRHFFVAHLAEALAIRPLLPADCPLYVLNGLVPGAEALCADQGVVPVLNSVSQVAGWRQLAVTRGAALPAVLQVDSGMARLGLSAAETAALADDDTFRRQVPLRAVMSHLACADDPANPESERQRRRFQQLASLFPGVPRSLANSAGCLLDHGFHGDIARPGIALYGGDPTNPLETPFEAVVRLEARVLQLRSVPAGAGAGYGLSWHARGTRRLATLSIGYADGWPRHLSNRGSAFVRGIRAPIAGRVSMDSTIIDVTDVPEAAIAEGDLVELIGPNQRLDDVARDAGTISYEILTGLGHRYQRRVLSAPEQPPTLEISA